MALKRKKVDPNAPNTIGSLEYKIGLCQSYIQVWQRLFEFFSESLEDKNITPEEERDFARVVYQTAFEHFKFTSLMKSRIIPHHACQRSPA